MSGKRLANLINHVKNLGVSKAAQQLNTMRTLRVGGTLKGKDIYGNEYFDEEDGQIGRDRWVVYGKSKAELNGSQIPPEWHQWLHRMTDDLPSSPEIVKPPKYAKQHQPNYTGTDESYNPHNFIFNPKYMKSYTHREKVEEWIPRKGKE